MRTNSNAAYDLSLFEPKTKTEPERQEAPAAQRQHIKTRRRRAASGAVAINPAQAIRWVAAGALCMVALLSIMLCNVQLTKLSDEVSKTQQKLSSTQADEVRLNMQLQSRVSLDNVENYAVNKLGMQKVGQYQVSYIHITNQDQVVLGHGSENLFTRFYDWILAYL